MNPKRKPDPMEHPKISTFLTTIPSSSTAKNYQIRNVRRGPHKPKSSKLPKDKINENLEINIEGHLANLVNRENKIIMKENKKLLEEKMKCEEKIIELEVLVKTAEENQELLGNQIHRQNQLKDFFATEVESLRGKLSEVKVTNQQLSNENEEMKGIIEKLSQNFERIEKSTLNQNGAKGKAVQSCFSK